MVDMAAERDLDGSFCNLYLQMLPERDFKSAFAGWFCVIYGRLVERMLDVSRDVQGLSSRMIHVSVQLYCGPSITMQCIQENHLLHVLVDAVGAICRGMSANGQFNNQSLLVVEHRYWCATSDLANVLTFDLAAALMLRNISPLVDAWLTALSSLHRINPNVRELLTHVTYETDAWSRAFSVEMEICSNALQLLAQGALLLSVDELCALVVACRRHLDLIYDAQQDEVQNVQREREKKAKKNNKILIVLLPLRVSRTICLCNATTACLPAYS